jgi:hypothetical protein
MRSLAKLSHLVSAIRKDGPTNELLKETVILLADHIIDLQRELDRVQHVATRADRNSRMLGGSR